ncbi:MAG TPA: DUF4199 domain-containing protein [Longimicrobiaceae bacterium]|nr:DUF4199 domain-containing protein [Longimicrobiaceae bacterium]
MKKTVWTFGLIAGAVLSVMMLLTLPFMHQIGYDQAMVIGYTTMVLAFLMVFFGIRSYRDNVAGGTVGFGRALAVGALIVAIASVCYVATWEVICFKLEPDMLTEMTQFQEAHVRESGGTPEEVQRKLAEARRFAEMYKNPAVMAAFTLLEPLPVGLVIALVSAGILSRRRRRSEDAGLVPAAG